jgi:starch-binding outer membrane protein, SusD/RagB family
MNEFKKHSISDLRLVICKNGWKGNVVFFRVYMLFMVVLQLSCKKFVTVDAPNTSFTSENVYKDDATAATVITGIYSKLSAGIIIGGTSISSVSLVASLSADELFLYGGSANGNITLTQYFQNRLTPGDANTSSPNLWRSLYAQIYVTNLAIENLNSSASLTPAVKQQLIGEAKFLRSFFYFYLLNFYGDVPLITTSDYRITSNLPRVTKAEVYNQIIADLKDAQNHLSNNYLAADAYTTTFERVRPNKSAASALLARVYLYMGEWDDAEMYASNVINNSNEYDTTSLNDIFLKNSKEAIWQLQPVNLGWNTEEAKVYILPPAGPSFFNPVYLSSQLLNAFESGDKRKANWVRSITVGSGATSGTYYYPYKYKSAVLNSPVTEYTTVLRLGEQYLIRAEARAHLNKISEGLRDLNVIRYRAGLSDATASDKNFLLNLVQHERQVELFTEWGHRWLDLRRTGKIDEVMGNYASQKGTSWSSNWALYPIPLYDIIKNPNLTQNAGY